MTGVDSVYQKLKGEELAKTANIESSRHPQAVSLRHKQKTKKVDAPINNFFHKVDKKKPQGFSRNRKERKENQSRKTASTAAKRKSTKHTDSESDSDLEAKQKKKKMDFDLSDISSDGISDDDGADDKQILSLQDLLAKAEALKKEQLDETEEEKQAREEREKEQRETREKQEKARLKAKKDAAWRDMQNRMKRAPTRNEMLNRKQEQEDDGANDIDFKPVGYSDPFTLDLRETKVRRQVHQHAEKQGWPTLDRDAIVRKIDACFPSIYEKHILPLLENGGDESHAFYKAFTDYVGSAGRSGISNSTLLMYLGSRMYTTGYYSGEFPRHLGRYIVEHGVAQDIEKHVRANKAWEKTILRPGLLFHFQTAICVPEVVIRLIMDDMDVSYEEADQIRLRSAEYGTLVAEKIKEAERAAEASSSEDEDENRIKSEDEDEDGIKIESDSELDSDDD
ncbi:hypothetical protein CJU89_6117 [Yarrowia sp. B02]|nr:hypothetical protein CJU89_6117 [Yarrowia sp. B02]